jgi:hypothetical protein
MTQKLVEFVKFLVKEPFDNSDLIHWHYDPCLRSEARNPSLAIANVSPMISADKRQKLALISIEIF